MRVDLHIHSKFSDGEDSPGEIVAAAKRLGLEAVALTDHDTVDGVDELQSAAQKAEIRAIPAIELSSERHKEIHILGYGIDHRDPRFLGELEALKELRRERNLKILKLLQKYKVFLTEKDIEAQSGETIGRMHIAKAMKQKGYVSGIGEAFDRYLAHGKKAYVRCCRISTEKAIEIISQAGGVAVLAHPFQTQLPKADLEKLIADLRKKGLGGIEAYYTGHTPEQTAFLEQVASRHGLLKTLGSDYHGKLRANSLGGVEKEIDLPF